MTLQEYEEQGRCIGCPFYRTVDIDGRQGCTFHWFDDESDDWEMDRNCKDAEELQLNDRAEMVHCSTLSGKEIDL